MLPPRLDSHGSVVWAFVRDCQSAPKADPAELLCRHAALATGAEAAHVFEQAGEDVLRVALYGKSRLNGEAAGLARPSLRSGNARYFRPVQLPLFEGAGDEFPGACVPFTSVRDGRRFALLVERASGQRALDETDQSVLLTLAMAAGFQVGAVEDRPPRVHIQVPRGLRHDPEGRRARHNLRFLHAKIIGESPALLFALHRLERALRSTANILILGESGVGKEQMARTVVEEGRSQDWNFVKVNTAGLPPTLIESELFGHVKGAFTGAWRDKVGLVGGPGKTVIFLDEIGNLPMKVQDKLLQFTESGEYRRVGDEKLLKAQARIVAATSRDMTVLMKEEKFLPDLYSRLAKKVIRVPALRDRGADTSLMLTEFFGEDATRFGKEVREAISSYDWPGNVREFRDVLEDLLDQTDGEVRGEHLRNEIAYRPQLPRPETAPAKTSGLCLKRLPDPEKKRLIQSELEKNGGDLGAIRRAANYSREGWGQLLKRLEMKSEQRDQNGRALRTARS